jgi:hypothetical protein
MIRKDYIIGFALALLLLCRSENISAGEIHEAAKEGNFEKIKSIFAADSSRLSVQDAFGYTPLHWAALMKHKDIVKYLIDMGAEINIAGLDGCTPLHSAAGQDAVAIIGMLIKKGAAIETRDAWGNTPLHIACRSGSKKAVEILLFQGADINALSNEKWTPLHYAFGSGHKKLAEYLVLSRNAGTDLVDDSGKTASEYSFRRPYPINIDSSRLEDYTGKYHLGGSFYSKVWIEDGRLWIQDYAHYPLYYIAPDSFFCENEPWMVHFTRNEIGKVDSIHLTFLRGAAGGKRVPDDFKAEESRPRLGLAGKSLMRGEVSDINKRAIISLDTASDTVAALITFVLEDTPADKAGIRWSDIIVSFNNIKVTNIETLYRLAEAAPSGKEVPVDILRTGGMVRVNLVLN